MSTKAIGKLVWDIDINDARATQSLNNLKAEIRNANRQWRDSSSVIKNNGDYVESNRVKINGLNEAIQKQTEYNKYLKNTLEHTNATTELTGMKYRKYMSDLDKGTLATKRMQAQLDIAKQSQARYATAVVELTNKNNAQTKASKELVKALKSEGKYREAANVQQKSYKTQNENLNLQLKKELEAMDSMSKIGSKNSESLFKQQQRVNRLRTEIANLHENQRKYNLDLDNTRNKNKDLISALDLSIQQIRKQKDYFKANVEEMKVVREKSNLLTEQYKLEHKELSSLGSQYGKNSSQYLNQVNKIGKLTNSITDLNNKEISLRKTSSSTYGTIGKLSDKINRHADTLNRTGSALHNAGMKLQTTSSLVDGVFTDGIKNNYKLTQSYQRTHNLISASNTETTNTTTSNMQRLKKESADLSQQYGENQQKLAAAAQELVKRGYSSNQMLGALKPLLQASAASGDDLSDALHVTTSSLESFGLKSDDTKQMLANTSDMVNTMTYSADMSSTSFQDLGVALSYTGSTARSAGIDSKQVAAAIGELSNHGINFLSSQPEMIA